MSLPKFQNSERELWRPPLRTDPSWLGVRKALMLWLLASGRPCPHHALALLPSARHTGVHQAHPAPAPARGAARASPTAGGPHCHRAHVLTPSAGAGMLAHQEGPQGLAQGRPINNTGCGYIHEGTGGRVQGSDWRPGSRVLRSAGSLRVSTSCLTRKTDDPSPLQGGWELPSHP